MASPIATLFARLGFDVDEKGLKRFEGQLKTLKNDINNLGGIQEGFTKNSMRDNKSLNKSLRDSIQHYGKLKNEIDKAAKSSGQFKNIKPTFEDVSYKPSVKQPVVRPEMDTSKVDRSTTRLKNNIKDVVAGYGRVPKTLQDAQRDMGRLQKLQSRGGLSAVDTKAIVDAQARVQNRISYLEQKRAKEVADRFNKTQKERQKLYEKELKDRERAQKSFTDNFNKKQKSILSNVKENFRDQTRLQKNFTDNFNKDQSQRWKQVKENSKAQQKAQKNFTDQFNRDQKQRWDKVKENNKKQEASDKKRVGLLERIEKTYDKHGKQLRDLRREYSFVNDQYRQGNIGVERRNQLLQEQFQQYRNIQQQQRRAVRDRGAGGIYAGGEDPRQVGNHRLISALHSDTGLAAMVGGFGALQSSLFYQDYVAAQQGINAAMGGAETGSKEFEWLIEMSDTLGISFRTAADNYKNLAAATKDSALEGEPTRDIFRSTLEYSKALRISQDDVKGVMRALTQMQSKGIINQEELSQQFGERLPGGFEAAARSLNMTTQELRKATEQGEITAEQLFPALSKELARMARRGGQLQEAINSTGSAFDRLGNAVTHANTDFNEAGFDRGMRRLSNSISNFLNESEGLISFFGMLSGAVLSRFGIIFEVMETFGFWSTKLGKSIDFLEEKGLNLEVAMMGLTFALGAVSKWFRRIFWVVYLLPWALSLTADTLQGNFGDDMVDKIKRLAAALVSVYAAVRLIKGVKGALGKVTGFFGGGKYSGTPPLKPSAGAAAQGGLMSRMASSLSRIAGILSTGKLSVAVMSLLGASTLAAAFAGLGALIIQAIRNPFADTGSDFESKYGDITSDRGLSDNFSEMKSDIGNFLGGLKSFVTNDTSRNLGGYRFDMPNSTALPSSMTGQQFGDFLEKQIDRLYHIPMNEQQAKGYLVQGGINITIDGAEDPQVVSEEVLRTIQNVFRETASLEPETEQ